MKLVENLMYRNKLIKTFRNAEIYLGSDEKPIFPKIKRVEDRNGNIEMIFILPSGVNPKDVEKKEYVFQQNFGKKIELDVDFKVVKLTLIKATESINVYDYSKYESALKKHKLGVICGYDRAGKLISYDMVTHPHLLIAGETGSGKSTQLRQLLTTLIQNNSPRKLQFYLADCKKSEFHIFRNVEHVKCVYSSARDIKLMLKKIKQELDERSNLLDEFVLSHIDELPKEHKKPYIIVCIDEFVMLRDEKEITEILLEVVSIGRALGVFAILSMQRPSANVLDTRIRSCLTVSMGFQLRDVIEERIVNTKGASKLTESGEFILNLDKDYRLMAPYVELEVAKELLSPFYVKKEKVLEKVLEVEEITEREIFNDFDEER